MLVPSYKKINKQTEFYERESFVNIFKEELNRVNSEDINILMYYGIGGIGKTTLLKHLYENHTNNNIKVFINIEDYSNPITFYSKLILELFKQNIKLFNFKIAFAIYWNKLNPNLAMKENEAFKGEWEAIIPIVDEIGFGVGSIFKALYDCKDNFKNKFLNNYKQELEELESMNYKEIEMLLPKFLNYDLTNNMKDRNETIIFFFDTHEFLFETNKKENNKLKCDTFLRDMILSTYEIKNLFVISGREKLIWEKENEEWSKYINHIELNAISKESAFNYLKDNGVKEDNIIKHIIDYTDCVPFYLNLELNTYLRLDNPTIQDFNSSKTKKDIFNRFMLYADNNELQLLKVLSFTKKFNLELFSEIIKEFNIPISILMFDDFISNSYVTSLDDDNFSLHNLMKLSIQDSVNHILKEKINTFLFNFYENDVLEQINYAMNLYSIIEIYDYVNKKIETTSLKNDTFKLAKIYQIIINNYRKEIIDFISNKIENDEIKYFTYFYVDLGLLYIKTKNKIEFNILNQETFENLSLNREISSLKNYVFLQNILSNGNANFEKTLNFIDKIELDYLPYNYKIDFKIDLANFYRKNKKLNKSENIFNELEKEFENFSNENKFQFYMKKGFLYKNFQNFSKSIESFNEAKKYITTKENEAKLYRGLGELYFLNKELELSINNFKNSIEIYDKLYGILNEESLICFNLLSNNKLSIDNKYFKVLNLINKDSNIDVMINNLNILLQNEKDLNVIVNIFNSITKKLFKLNMNLDLTILEQTLYSKLNKDSFNDVYMMLYMYYKSFDFNKSIKYIKELYESTKNINLLKIISYQISSEIFFTNFEESFNNIKNNNIKFDILLNLNEFNKAFDLFLELNDLKYFYILYKLPINILLKNIELLENNFNNKNLDIIYTNILDYYYLQDFDTNLGIEKYLIKQIDIRVKYNLDNLGKGYSFLGKFYQDTKQYDLVKENYIKAYDLLDPEKDKKIIEKISYYINKVE